MFMCSPIPWVGIILLKVESMAYDCYAICEVVPTTLNTPSSPTSFPMPKNPSWHS